MRRTLLVIPVSILAACASGSSTASSPSAMSGGVAASIASAPDPAAGLRVQRIPTMSGAYRLRGMHRFARPELGVGFRYADGDPLRLDVYVYPAPDEVRTSPDPVAAAWETARTELRMGLEEEIRKGNVDTFEVQSDSAVTYSLSQGLLTGSHATLQIVTDGEAYDSHQHHFLVGDQLVKVRATYRDDSVSPEETAGFVRDFLDALTNPQPPTRRSRQEPG